MIKAHNSQRKWEQVRDFVMDGFDKIHKSEKIFNAQFTEQVEEKIQRVSGRKYALMCSSGSHAITMSLRAHGIKPGDKVVIPNYSAPATLSSVTSMGAIPVFCDLNKYGMMSADHLPSCMEQGVKAVLATGLYGDIHDHEAVLDFCRKNNTVYINDAAQSQFAKYNGVESLRLGDAACMSFADNKTIPIAGTYGAMLTNDVDVYNRLRALRSNGKPSRSEFKGKIETRPRPACSEWNAHKYAILVENKFEAYKTMLAEGVETEQHYTENFANLSWTPKTDKQFPMTDKFIKQSLTIPNNPFMTDAEVEIVTKKVLSKLQK